jgi:hypothetical protein
MEIIETSVFTRIIYFWHEKRDKLYMLLAYKKSEIADLAGEQLKALADHVKGGVL